MKEKKGVVGGGRGGSFGEGRQYQHCPARVTLFWPDKRETRSREIGEGASRSGPTNPTPSKAGKVKRNDYRRFEN